MPNPTRKHCIRRTSPIGICTPFTVCLHRINTAEKVLYASFIFLTQNILYAFNIPKMKGSDTMSITSGYTPMNLRPIRGIQPTASQPAPAPKQQPMQEPNLSPQPEKVAVTEPQKPAPKQPAEQPAEPTEKSTKRFALRLTQKQRNQIKKLQKSWGLSTESAVIKKLIDDSKEENNSSDLALQIGELTAIKTELNRIGININQIAKKANQMDMTMDDLNAVMKYMKDVCDIIYGKGVKE